WGETDRLSLIDDPNISTLQKNEGISTGNFAFTRFGVDYFINNRNTLTLTQSIMGGKFGSDNQNNLIYRTVNSGNIESQYRNTVGDRKFNNYTTTLGFKH